MLSRIGGWAALKPACCRHPGTFAASDRGHHVGNGRCRCDADTLGMDWLPSPGKFVFRAIVITSFDASAEDGLLLVVTFDAPGIVRRLEDLRAATQRAAEKQAKDPRWPPELI